MIPLDTDVMIDILRGYSPAVEWLKSLGDQETSLPGYVMMELLQGCVDRQEQERLERELSGCTIVWPAPDDCDAALALFARFHLSHGIGVLDALIGQTAASLDLPLHTFNRKHYAVFDNLDTIQPYNK